MTYYHIPESWHKTYQRLTVTKPEEGKLKLTDLAPGAVFTYCGADNWFMKLDKGHGFLIMGSNGIWVDLEWLEKVVKYPITVAKELQTTIKR